MKSKILNIEGSAIPNLPLKRKPDRFSAAVAASGQSRDRWPQHQLDRGAWFDGHQPVQRAVGWHGSLGILPVGLPATVMENF